MKGGMGKDKSGGSKNERMEEDREIKDEISACFTCI